MNIESTILKTLLSLIENHLSKGDTDFDFDELEDETVSDSVFSNTPHPVLRLALKPLLTQELRELLQKIFLNDPEAKKILILKLSKGEFPTAVRHFIISVLTKGLKHQYSGPREVLQNVLVKSNVNLRHEYSLTMNDTYQSAMELIANPSYRPAPTPKPTFKRNKKPDED